MADIFSQAASTFEEGNKTDIFAKAAEEDLKFDVGGIVTGAGEIAANLATQAYGLPARGYGEIADLITDIKQGKELGTSRQGGIADKVSGALVYDPKTEYGKAGMYWIASAFDWWHQKSIGFGEGVQGAVEPIVGKDAAKMWGVSAASTMEALPLALGEVYGKGKTYMNKRNAAKDYAEIKSKLAEQPKEYVKPDYSSVTEGDIFERAAAGIPEGEGVSYRKTSEGQFGETIPGREVKATGYTGEELPRGAVDYEAAWREYSEGAPGKAYVGEEIPSPPPARSTADEWVTGREPSYDAQWEKLGTDVADRISRGYLGDESAISGPRPDVAPLVGEYGGPGPKPKQLTGPKEEPPVKSGIENIEAGLKSLEFQLKKNSEPKRKALWDEYLKKYGSNNRTPEGLKAKNELIEKLRKMDIVEFPKKPVDYHAEAGKLESAPPVKYVGDLGGHPMFQQEAPGVGSFIKKPNETVEQAFNRAKEKYKGKGGSPLDNERGSAQIINDAARAIKEFFLPLSTIPGSNAYMLLRYKDLRGGITRANRITKLLSDRLKTLSVQDKKDAFNAIRGEIPLDTLPVELQGIVKQTIADLDRVGSMLVRHGLLKRETFEAHKGQYIHYMYLRHILPDDVSLPTTSGRMDMSYLLKRIEEKHPEMSRDAIETIRQDLGLIEDVSIAAPIGMGKALGDLVKKDFFKKVAENPDWVWQPSREIAALTKEYNAYKTIIEKGEDLSPQVIDRFRQLESAINSKSAAAGKAPKDFIKLPDNKSYGDLSGTFIRREIANDIMPVFSITPKELAGLAKLWSKAGGAFDVGMTMFKISKVALNPPTVFRNIVSNFAQINMSGIPLNELPNVVIEGIKSYKAKDNIFRQFERYGGTSTNFSVAEIGEILNTFEKVKGGNVDKFMLAMKDLAKYYGRIDDIAKLALYKDAIVNKGMSPAEAMLHAQKWGMDYSLASRSVKLGRRYALPFLSYQYKIAPLIAESLAKNPLTIGKYFAIPYVAAQIAAHAFDWSDKDLDKAQKMMAERTKHQGEFMLLPWKDNKGNVEMVNMEYFLPWGNWLQTVRDLRGGEFVDAAKQFGSIAGPFGNALIMLGTKRAGEPPKDPFTGQPVYSKLDSQSTKYLKYTEWTFQLFAPSSISSKGALGYTYKAATGQKDRWGTEATAEKAFGRWFGVNVGSLDTRQVIASREAKLKELDLEIHKIDRDPSYSQEERKEARKRLIIERRKILKPE